ncbi:MAG: DUF982 domain-containing protein [Rhizobiaceae bacterium]|nr:DUF982 domain-containing protein [Rhizobiaceae bacterium]MCV0406079.1 DUF982 domain-containing protein [Rhizobiaceae bacterium]
MIEHSSSSEGKVAANQAFHEPVRLRREGNGISEVRTPLEAAMALSKAWPPTRGKWYWAASRACADAVEGRTSVQVARRIFVQAVQESRLDA